MTNRLSLALPMFLTLACRAPGAVIGDDTDIASDTGSTADTGGEPATGPSGCAWLTNGDAEAGDTSGWESIAGNFQAVGSSGSTPEPLEGAYQFFAGTSARAVLEQVVAVPGADVGGFTAHLAAHVRTWDGDDRGSMALEAFDGSGTSLGAVEVGPFTDTYYRERRAHLALPPGTASVATRLIGERQVGTDNDAYFDNVSLCVDALPPPENVDLLRGPWLTWVTPTAISILWETQGAAVGGVQWGQTGLDEELLETVASDHHEVRLSGLEPDTVYSYRILTDGLGGEVFSFRTAPDAAVPFDFAVWGDNQNGPDVFAQVTARMAAGPAEFAISTGDIVQNGTEGEYRDQLLGPLESFASERSFLVAAGNHERYSDSDATLFDLHLAQPADEHCFGWTYGGAYFLFIDTELDITEGSAQHTCIEEALASPAFEAADVQFALFHYPPRIEFWAWFVYDGISLYDGDSDVRAILEPMFAQAGVDLVFNGHNHLYNYTPAGEYSSVAWVTTGGGGGDIDTAGWRTATWEGIATTAHEHHFLEVRVDGRQVDVQAVRPDGGVVDSFTLKAD